MGNWGVMGNHKGLQASHLPRSVVQDYLDSAIRRWRSIAQDRRHQHHEMAPFYVDAFQSARMSLLGETLQIEAQSPQPGPPQDSGPLQPWHSQPNPEEKIRYMRQRQREEGIKNIPEEQMAQDASRKGAPLPFRRAPFNGSPNPYKKKVMHDVGSVLAWRRVRVS